MKLSDGGNNHLDEEYIIDDTNIGDFPTTTPYLPLKKQQWGAAKKKQLVGVKKQTSWRKK